MIAALAGTVGLFLCSETAAAGLALHFSVFLSVFFITGYGNAQNDIIDHKSDKINHSKRPLPTGVISLREALTAAFFLLVAGLLSALSAGFRYLTAAAAVSFILFLYNAFLKKTVFIGNAAVASVSAFTFIYGPGGEIGYISDSKSLIPCYAAAGFAFLIHFLREIYKDIEDVQGDRKYGVKTAPVKFGEKKSALMAAGVSLLLIPIFAWTASQEVFSGAFYIIAVPGVLLPVIIMAIRTAYLPSLAGKTAKLMKPVMAAGIAAALAGVYL